MPIRTSPPLKTKIYFLVGFASALAVSTTLSSHAFSTDWIGTGKVVSSASMKTTLDEIQTRLSDLETNAIPPGTIAAYGGETVPTGWLLCDGAAVSRNQYARLFNALQISWGGGDGVNTFNVPDLRGMFLRGTDRGAGRDPDVSTRTPINAGGASGDNVGSVETAAFGTHAHGVPINTPGNGGGSVWGNIPLNNPNTMWGSSNGNAGYVQRSEPVGGTETRPLNANVHYIVKY